MEKKRLGELLNSTHGGSPEDFRPRTLLDPIVERLDSDDRFKFYSELMEFIGSFMVKVIDFYDIELSKISNALSLISNKSVEHARYLTNQVSLAKRNGNLKEEKPTFAVPGQFSNQKDTRLTKRKQATPEDVKAIAASIRNLIKSQKAARNQEHIGEAPLPLRHGDAKEEIKDIGEKVEAYKKSQEEQKTRIRDTETKVKRGKGGIASAKTTAATTAKKRAQTAEAAAAARAKKINEKDFLPKGFKDQLMKNIKDLMKEKEN
ncbi:MAG: hypothetical protein ACTSUE_06790 [Promethearchaeota archaeon]